MRRERGEIPRACDVPKALMPRMRERDEATVLDVGHDGISGARMAKAAVARLRAVQCRGGAGRLESRSRDAKRIALVLGRIQDTRILKVVCDGVGQTEVSAENI